MLKPLAIFGASWHGREVLQLVLDANIYVGQGCFLDDMATGKMSGLPVMAGSFVNDPAFVAAHRFIVTIGDNAARLRIGRHILNLGGEVITVIHPTALVWHEAEIGIGSVVFPFAIVSDSAKVGQFCIVNKHATVGHGAVMEDGSNVSDRSSFSGRIGTESMLGLHVACIPGVDIGARCTVGAGAVCIRSVPDDTVVVGNPARKI